MNIEKTALKLLKLAMKDSFTEDDRQNAVNVLESVLESLKSKYDIGDIVMCKQDLEVGTITDIEQVIDTGEFFYQIGENWIKEDDIAFKYNFNPSIGDKVVVGNISGIVKNIYDCRDYVPEPDILANEETEREYSKTMLIAYSFDLTMEDYTYSPWVELYIEDADMISYVPIRFIKKYTEE